MTDFIVKLEDLLLNSGIDYEIIYMPKYNGYILKLDGTAVFMTKLDA